MCQIKKSGTHKNFKIQNNIVILQYKNINYGTY